MKSVQLSVLLSLGLFAASAQADGFPRAGDSMKELSWASVHLNGMHLRLVSPKSKNQTEDLWFGDGTLASDICSGGECTNPLTIWKIENNRLKTGYVPTEGDVLVKFTDKNISIRRPDGKVYVYSIVPKTRA